MIIIPVSVTMDNIDAIRYLEKEVDSGIASHHIDGKHHVVAFYNPEDEAAFILRFGKTFMAEGDKGFFYCPYIPVLTHIDLKIKI